MIERLKDIIVILFSTLLGFFSPISDFTFAILLLMMVNLLTFLMAIFWCAVEYLSIREKASEKVHSHIAKVKRLESMMKNRR